MKRIRLGHETYTFQTRELGASVFSPFSRVEGSLFYTPICDPTVGRRKNLLWVVETTYSRFLFPSLEAVAEEAKEEGCALRFGGKHSLVLD